MDKGVIQVATCQFPVCASIEHNAGFIRELMQQAAMQKADVVHFSECALSGYASVDFAGFDENYDWDLLKTETNRIMELAGKLGLWVVLGSSHRLTPPHKPHNCLYLINPEGELVDRYDKRFGTELDMDNYTPGDRFVYFDVNGVKCSLLICFDLRFPELYRALYKQGVRCIFQSFYNARQQGPSVHSEIMRQTMQARAATNGFWISMTNSCGWFAPYPSCFIQPDGRIVEQLPDHKEDLMIHTVDTNQTYYDPSALFRDMAINGKLTNAPEPVDDERSANVTQL